MEVVGNTVFGSPFEEDANAFEKVLAEVDDTRITSPAVLPADEEAAPEASAEPEGEE